MDWPDFPPSDIGSLDPNCRVVGPWRRFKRVVEVRDDDRWEQVRKELIRIPTAQSASGGNWQPGVTPKPGSKYRSISTPYCDCTFRLKATRDRVTPTYIFHRDVCCSPGDVKGTDWWYEPGRPTTLRKPHMGEVQVKRTGTFNQSTQTCVCSWPN